MAKAKKVEPGDVETLQKVLERHIVGFEWRDPKTMAPHPENNKRHAWEQREAFEAFAKEVGWLDVIKFNKRTGRILDGHMRQDYAIENNLDRVPVLMLDVPEELEPDIILLFDPIGDLHRAKKAESEMLLRAMATDNEILNKLARATVFGEKIQKDDEDVIIPETELPDGGISMVIGEEYNYIVLLFRTKIDWVAAQDYFELKRVQCAFHPSGTTTGIGRVIDGGEYINKVLGEKQKLAKYGKAGRKP